MVKVDVALRTTNAAEVTSLVQPLKYGIIDFVPATNDIVPSSRGGCLIPCVSVSKNEQS